jgi:hypothetical protein
VAGDERGYWRGDSWPITVASSPAMTRRARASHYDEVLRLARHVSSERQTANSGELIHSGHDMLVYGGRSRIVAGVYLPRDISYRGALI